MADWCNLLIEKTLKIISWQHEIIKDEEKMKNKLHEEVAGLIFPLFPKT
jgi:hypothetical protein